MNIWEAWRAGIQGRMKNPIVVGVVILLVLEVFVFNFPFWATLTNSGTAMTPSLGPGLEKTNEGRAKITNNESSWIEFKNKDVINYFYITPSSGEDGINQVKWKISTKKAQDGNWYEATGESGYSPLVNNSRYIHVGGLTTKIRLKIEAANGDIIPVSQYVANPRVPFRISLSRLILEVVLISTYLAIRPKSILYQIPFSARNIRCVTPIVVTAAVGCVSLLWFWGESGGLHTTGGINRLPNGSYFDADQYAHVADALIHGHVYLDMPVDPGLAAMDNPYDAASRIALSRNSDLPILFDTAFKDGKYYSYFGVLPAVLLFVPYQLATGHYMPVGYAVIILGILAFILGILLCVQLARLVNTKHSINTGVVLLACIFMFLGSGIAHNIQIGLFYQIPQTSALVFIQLAFICWIEAKTHNLSKIWMSLGALSAAMVIGCRPQFMLSLIVAIPLFWKEIVDLWVEGKGNRQGLVKEISIWSSVIIPFVIGLIPFALYNYLRFGSILDFGANYNLTGYDMTHHQLPVSLLAPLTFLYFLQPPNISTGFPFIMNTPNPMPLWLPMQPSYGGFFTFIAPFAFITFFPTFWKSNMRKNGLFSTCCTLLIYSIIVFAFDSHIVGYDLRYMLDFNWSIILACTLMLYSSNIGLYHSRNVSISQDTFGPHFSLILLKAITCCVLVSSLMLYFKQFGGSVSLKVIWNTASWFTAL